MYQLDTCLQLTRAAAEVRRRFDSTMAAAHGLSLNDFIVLRVLADAPAGRLRRVDLADRLGLTPSGATRLLAPLEKLGYVTRHANPSDARVALTELTEKGRALARDATATAEDFAEELLQGRLTEVEAGSLRTALARLAPVM